MIVSISTRRIASAAAAASTTSSPFRQMHRRLFGQKTYYSPQHHVWIRTFPPVTTNEQQQQQGLSSAVFNGEAATTAETIPSLASPNSLSIPNLLWRLQVGMTQAGLDELGDIVAIRRQQQQQQQRVGASSTTAASLTTARTKAASAVAFGEDLFCIEWEGFEQTAADELYHTVWKSIEGHVVIPSPVTGQILCIVPETLPQRQEIDSDTVLVELACTETELGTRILNSLVITNGHDDHNSNKNNNSLLLSSTRPSGDRTTTIRSAQWMEYNDYKNFVEQQPHGKFATAASST